MVEETNRTSTVAHCFVEHFHVAFKISTSIWQKKISIEDFLAFFASNWVRKANIVNNRMDYPWWKPLGQVIWPGFWTLEKNGTNQRQSFLGKITPQNSVSWWLFWLLNISVKWPVRFELVLMWRWKCFYHMNATHRFSSQLCVLSRNIIMADRKRVVGNHLMLLQIACYPYSSQQV